MNGASDPTLAEIARIKALIQEGLSSRIRCLHISLDEKGLVLRGQTRTYYAKQLAQHAAMKASKFPIRANQIEVSWTGS
jgi:hypothetical protein